LDLKDIGLVVFSRPCNPSGNVLHDSEVKEIVKQAGKKNIPVIVDSAYASPVPNVCYTPMKYVRGKNVITTFSFSKAGLAAARLGVAVGDKKYIDAVKAFQANVCIFPPVFGQEVARRMLHNGKLARLCEKEVKPFYKKKLEIFRKACAEFIDDAVPYFIHKSEGTFFAWIWFKDLPVNDWKLFELLKSQGVIVVPGSPFFPGAGKGWMHAQECIRLSVTGTEKDIRAGVKGLAGVVNKLYKK
ncbi:aminotransferase class I/II-fold pyridoxal phosphate-dependent enzyme, partial [Candidatus Micrarchaeota archaeon]|nr:aminotransferase class I/II-fold pyridoxal phosphate-dependent enzyme [Candidatus Micrarchaeota archaeon]